MPRNYKKKKSGPSYNAESLRAAVEDVRQYKLSQRAASKKYGIPKTVIHNWIYKDTNDIEVIGAGGRKPTLSSQEEADIENCLLARAKFGYPCDRKELLTLVGKYVEVNKKVSPFKNNVPGEDWYLGFMKRHPRLSLKKAEHLQKQRQNATDPEIVYDFYDKLQRLCNEKGLTDQNKACFIFNADESGFNSDPSRLRGIGEKGRSLSRVSGGSGRESTTVLACISADGYVLPPMVVFRGAAVQARWTSDKAAPGTLYTTSKNGWMEEPQFYSWFTSQFIPYVNELRERTEQPDQSAVLVFDGHKSHVSLRICEAAINSNICLVCLPSHLTDKLQPLDKCVFGPVKVAWDKELVEHGKKMMGKTHSRLSKKEFVEVLGEVWKAAITKKNVISGFENTGLFPVDATKFPTSEFNPIDLQKYKSKHIHQGENNTESQEHSLLSQVEDSAAVFTPDSLLQTMSPVCEEVPSNATTSDAMAGQTEQTASNLQPFIQMFVESLQKASKEQFVETLGGIWETYQRQRTKDKALPQEKMPSTFTRQSSSDESLFREEPSSDLVPTTTTRQNSYDSDSMSTTSTQKSSSHSRPNSSLQSVVEIFAERLQPSQSALSRTGQTPLEKKKGIRLKSLKYGEVLTAPEVMQRFKEAEAAKVLKETSKITGRARKYRNDKEENGEKNTVNKGVRTDKSAPPTKSTMNRRRSVAEVSDLSSDEDMCHSDAEKSDSLTDIDPFAVEVAEVVYEEPTSENIAPGKYVLVTIKGGSRMKTTYRYACCIQRLYRNDDKEDDDDEEEEEDIEVMALKHQDQNSSTFIADETDVFVVKKSEIIGVLPEPDLINKDRRIMYVFPGTVPVFERA